MVIVSHLIYNCFQLIFFVVGVCQYQVILHQLSHPQSNDSGQSYIYNMYDILRIRTAAWISYISAFFK